MNDQTEHNIAHYLPDMAATFPHKRAVVVPQGRDDRGRVAYTHLTFSQLDALCDRYARGLQKQGVARDMRVLLMVKPGLDFFALTFALFKLGAVPVLIDPGMGWGAFMRCVARTAPEGFIGIPAAHVLRLLRPRFFRSVSVPITLGRRLFWGGAGIHEFPDVAEPFAVTPVAEDDVAAILFTTGSTGPAKGVVYTHRIFNTQTETLRSEYGITPDDIDLPCFPLFALFSTALGVTAVIPDMDPTRPASVNPERIIEAVQNQGVTYSFGSPTLWRRVSEYCAERNVRFPTLTRILMAGAPVPEIVHSRLLRQVLGKGAQTHTPYGATESLPVANFTGTEMLAGTAHLTRCGKGMCVGRPLGNITVRIIGIDDAPIAEWSEQRLVPPGEIGEIVVRGPVVTREYDHLPEATALAKIPDGDGFWHRMGDVGYVDTDGRLWFCGRKSHRVRTEAGTLFTVQCEAIFNEHRSVYRSALVGVGATPESRTPVIVVEPFPENFPRTASQRSALAEELLALGAESELTRSVHHVLFHRSFPVDIRHNAKIRREVLADWAGQQLKATVL